MSLVRRNDGVNGLLNSSGDDEAVVALFHVFADLARATREGAKSINERSGGACRLFGSTVGKCHPEACGAC
jgi:hypothetical protein